MAQFRQVAEIEDSPWAAAALGNVYAASGQKDEALKELAKLEETASRRYVSPYFFALVYTGLNDRERAFDYLNKAYDEHNDYLIYLRVEPLFDSLRADPRFQDLLRRIRFPE